MNVPLKEGMTDEAYEKLFKPVMRKVMEIYQPEAIVFQSGQQSLMLLRPWLPTACALSIYFCTGNCVSDRSHNVGCMCRSGLVGW